MRGLTNAPGASGPQLEALRKIVQDMSQGKGKPGGFAPLGEDGKIPSQYITNEGGLVAQDEAPENIKLGWIDTAHGNVLKFYSAKTRSWVNVSAVWG